MEEYIFDAYDAKEKCVKWIRNWFDINGRDCMAVIGISGGKDSSVAAALCVEALGSDRVLGVLMPQEVQWDIEDSQLLCEHLKIKNVTINIGPIVDAALFAISANAKYTIPLPLSKQTTTNLPPRIRMTTLYAVSQSMNGRVVNTCNLSEDYIGYSTLWGDSVGDFAPLANFTSDEVVAIGDACGLPYDLTHKTPADGLCGKTDEDNIGFTYAILNKYIRTGICDDKIIKAKIDKRHNENLFKLKPIPTFEYKENINEKV